MSLPNEERIWYPMRQPMMACKEVWKFRLGADIYAGDGTAGKLVALVVDETERTLTHIGTRVHRFRRTYFVPIRRVTDGDADRVTLSIALAELETQTLTPQGSCSPVLHG